MSYNSKPNPFLKKKQLSKTKKTLKKSAELIKIFETEIAANDTKLDNIDSITEDKSEYVINNDVFDTLDDVSTDDSDVVVTNISIPLNNSTAEKIKSDEKLNCSNSKVVILEQKNYLTPIVKFHMDKYEEIKNQTKESSSSDSSNESFESSNSAKNEVENISEKLKNISEFVIDDGTSHKELESTSNTKTSRKRKRKSEKRFPDNHDLRKEPQMFKYWSQRYVLFERFDMGIKLDKKSWYSVTPEYIAKDQANECRESDYVFDGFCGAGGNTIQFSYRCNKVMAMDIDSNKIELAKHNSFVYGVEMDKINFNCEDFYSFSNFYENTVELELPKFDVVFLSPPWGGEDYLDDPSNSKKFDVSVVQMDHLMEAANKFDARMIMVYMPRNTDETTMKSYCKGRNFRVLQHTARFGHKKNKVKAVTFIYEKI